MMKYLFLLACVLGMSTSCKKEDHTMTESGLAFRFYPRQCSSIATFAAENSQAHNYFEHPPKVGYATKAQDFLLCLFTTNGPIKEIVAENPNLSLQSYFMMTQRNTSKFPTESPNKKLELLLGDDYYRGEILEDKKTRGTHQNELDMVYFQHWEYRLTGVKDFNIVATTPLFGQAAGTSLNPYFSIFEFYPKQIITHTTQSLVWGYRSQNKVETIAQWLALKPMAPPVIVFRFNAIPPEVPAHVKFVSILETTDGKMLRDTTEVEIRD